MNHFWSDPFHSFLGGGFGSLWNDMLGAPTATLLGTERKCPTCGMTESQLRQHRPRGLPGLLQHLRGYLEPLRRRSSTAPRATSAPRPPHPSSPSTDPVEALRAQLKTAVENEEYEQAARLRDEIRRMEGEQK